MGQVHPGEPEGAESGLGWGGWGGDGDVGGREKKISN